MFKKNLVGDDVWCYCTRSGAWECDFCLKGRCWACPGERKEGHIKHDFYCPCKGKLGGTRKDAGRPRGNPGNPEQKKRLGKLQADWEHAASWAKRLKHLYCEAVNEVEEENAVTESILDEEAKQLETTEETTFEVLEFIGKACLPLTFSVLCSVVGCFDVVYLAEFSKWCALRSLMWGAYVGIVTPHYVYVRAEEMGVNPDLVRTRCGTGHRELCKTTVFLLRILQTAPDLDTIVFTIILFRGWFNSIPHWKEFCRLHGLPGLWFDPRRWCEKDFLRHALAVKIGPNNTSRGHAYDPSTSGARFGQQVLPAFAAKMSRILSSVSKLCAFAKGCAVSPVSHSCVTLRWFQKLMGQFVGLQCALDAGYVHKPMFDQDLVSECGPGACAGIFKLFKGLPRVEGMRRLRSEQSVAAPLCEVVSNLLSTAPAAHEVRAVHRMLGLPPLGPAGVHYFSCELRQWLRELAARRFVDSFPWANAEYLAGIDTSCFNTWFVEPIP